MPRDSSGVYTLPGAYNPVVSGTVIQSAWANTTLADVAQGVTDSLDRSGRGAMLAPLKSFNGTVLLPGLNFSSETTTGFSRPSAGRLAVSILGLEVGAFTATGLDVAAISVAGSPFVPGNYLPLAGGTLTGALVSSDAGAAITLNNVTGVSIDFSGAGSAVNQINSYSSAAFELITRHATGELKLYTSNAVLALTIGSTQNAAFVADVSVGDDLTVTGDASVGVNLSVTGNVTAANLASGTYTPTLTNGTNVAASTPAPCQYTRVGNVVTVSGACFIDPTAAGGASTNLGISLPIASNFANSEECGGTAANLTSEAGSIAADATANEAILVFAAQSAANAFWSFTFTYRII